MDTFNQQVKTIEDLSLNAWPSHQIQIYDGWLLRFSYFYTHRTNSVEQIGDSTIPIEEKIHYCEEIYKKWGTPAIFKISPLIPASFEQLLKAKHYEVQHITDVMTMQLKEEKTIFSSTPVTLRNQITPEWINGLFTLKNTTSIIHRQIVPSMYRAIPHDVICACIYEDEKVKATGLGILDREYLGIYAIHVDEKHRGNHWGYTLCQSILNEGIRKGASKAYLQVVDGNVPAQNLYHKLGFEKLYTYWFRVKPTNLPL